MTWLEPPGGDRKILHLKADSGAWLPYYSFPALRQPDSSRQDESKGYRTMQHLLRSGWSLVPSSEAIVPVAV